MGFFTGLVGQWIIRRLLEIGGMIGALLVAYQQLPPGVQDMIARVLTGNWQELTLGAVIPLLVSIGGYIWSYVSTMKPQIVTAEKKQINIPVLTEDQAKDMVERETGVRPETIPTRKR